MSADKPTASAPAPKPRRTPAPPAPDALVYTINEAAEASRLSRATLYRHAAAGRLRVRKVVGRTLVDGASLRALIGVAP